MAILVLILGGVVVWAGCVLGAPVPPRLSSRPIRKPSSNPAAAFEPEGIWARHPLEPERGWCVAVNGGVPIAAGDEVDVRRKDGSRSLETVRRVLLEMHEPEGDVVGHLVEVEEA